MSTAASVSQGIGGCSVTRKVPSKEAASETPLLQPHTRESTEETSAGDVMQGKEAAQRYVTVWYIGTDKYLSTPCPLSTSAVTDY